MATDGNAILPRGFLRQARLVLASVLLVAALAGCSGQGGSKVKSYGQDGYMGLTNSLPGMPGRASESNHRADGKLITELVQRMDGVIDSHVQFAGDTIAIALQLDPALGNEEAGRLFVQAEQELQANFPSYTVKVTASKDALQ